MSTIRNLTALAVGGLLFATTAAMAATPEITVHPGNGNCNAAATHCYVDGQKLYTCTDKFCGNWEVFK
ncbi:MAG: hypothetical protein U1E46_09990 [Hyphomicrobiales bacterium]